MDLNAKKQSLSNRLGSPNLLGALQGKRWRCRRLEGAAGESCPSGVIREAEEPEMKTEGLGTGETKNEITRQRKKGCNVRLDLAV